ncbi:MAG: ABC transporter ATP-binding protein [Bacteroidota bacterium]
MQEVAIQIEGVSKTYGKTRALESLSLSIAPGTLFGLIGPDGAGKTTLIRILATLLLPTEGNATMQGYDVVQEYRQIRKLIGYMPGTFSLYQDLSIEENIQLFAIIFGNRIEDNYDMIRDIYVQIEPFKKRKAGALSGGMKQKLALCCALIHKPEVLLLDEPTTGVDAVSRREFWDMLATLKQHDITILVSTPYMDEALRCEEIALIQHGRILEVNTPQAIMNAFPHPLFGIETREAFRALQLLRKHPAAHSVYPFGDRIHFATQDEHLSPDVLAEWLRPKGLGSVHIEPIQPGIEDCFMERMVS